MQPPERSSKVKSLLGMAQYVSRFIPNYATIPASLCAFTHQKSVRKLDTEEETAFRKLQNGLLSERVMVYFDPTIATNVFADAIPTASRALFVVEIRYSQTEQEMLTAVWATEHYHLYSH